MTYPDRQNLSFQLLFDLLRDFESSDRRVLAVCERPFEVFEQGVYPRQGIGGVPLYEVLYVPGVQRRYHEHGDQLELEFISDNRDTMFSRADRQLKSDSGETMGLVNFSSAVEILKAAHWQADLRKFDRFRWSVPRAGEEWLTRFLQTFEEPRAEAEKGDWLRPDRIAGWIHEPYLARRVAWVAAMSTPIEWIDHAGIAGGRYDRDERKVAGLRNHLIREHANTWRSLDADAPDLAKPSMAHFSEVLLGLRGALVYGRTSYREEVLQGTWPRGAEWLRSREMALQARTEVDPFGFAQDRVLDFLEPLLDLPPQLKSSPSSSARSKFEAAFDMVNSAAKAWIRGAPSVLDQLVLPDMAVEPGSPVEEGGMCQ